MVSNKSFVFPLLSVDVFSRLIGNYTIFDFDFFRLMCLICIRMSMKKITLREKIPNVFEFFLLHFFLRWLVGDEWDNQINLMYL